MNKLIVFGNAILDFFSYANTSNLHSKSINIGSMSLIEEYKDFLSLLDENSECKIYGGGSAINTAVAFSKLGGNAKVLVKLGKDQYGVEFKKDLENIGLEVVVSYGEMPTGKSRIYISEEGERTMFTYLGCNQFIKSSDFEINKHIDERDLVFCEGYMFDSGSDLMNEISNLIKKKNIVTALTLSDPGCIARNFDKFMEFINKTNPIIFGNTKEIEKIGLENLNCRFVVHTKRDKGSEILKDRKIVATAPAFKVRKVVDSTGAGDVFAGAFLYKFINNSDFLECLEFANFQASKIVQQIGARL